MYGDNDLFGYLDMYNNIARQHFIKGVYYITAITMETIHNFLKRTYCQLKVPVQTIFFFFAYFER